MDEDNDQGVEGGEEIAHENGTTNRIAALEATAAAQQAKSVLAGLMADPDIQAVIRAKQAGKQITVAEAQAEAQAEAAVEPELDPVDESDPNKILLSNIGKLMDAKIGKLRGEFETQLGEVQHVTEAVTRRDVADSVAKARAEFKDFDQYKDGMVEIMKSVPGLQAKEYYLIAKHRAGKLRQVETVTASEKPTSQPARSHQQRGAAPAKRPQGRKGFSELLAEKLNGMNFEGSDTQ